MLRAVLQTFRLGLKNVLLHKLRSGLTILGILIGVTAVIWLVALGEGVSAAAQRQIEELGATNVIVRTVKPPDGSKTGSSWFLEYGLKRADFAQLAGLPNVVLAVPMRELPGRKLVQGERMMDARVVGCTADYLPMNRLQMARGRFLEDEDAAEVENVCVLANETAQELFPYEDPVGRTVRIDTQFYNIVGVTKDRGKSAGIGGSLAAQDFNRDAYIPLATLKQRIGDSVMTSRSGAREAEIVQLSQITLKMASLQDVDDAEEQIVRLLQRSHALKDYAVVVPKELLRQAEILRLLFTGLLVLIAGISLLVGGIGIMNIMLATVTERTREIGIRRALGAKRAHIMWQFLTETTTLTFIGGCLGVLIGLLVGPMVRTGQWFVAKYLPAVRTALPEAVRDVQPLVAPWSIGVSLAIAVFVGVFFGLYPAWKAARMDPIEALRHA